MCVNLKQLLHTSHEPGEQWGGIVFPPDKSQLERHVQIGHWQHNHSLGTSPARSSIDKPHTHPMRVIHLGESVPPGKAARFRPLCIKFCERRSFPCRDVRVSNKG